MCLTVRFARSFYEWSQRTGPDDLSETNMPVFQSPSESGHMPAGGPAARSLIAIPAPARADTVRKSRAPQAASEEAGPKEPCPEILDIQSALATTSGQSVFTPKSGAAPQVRAGPPGPAQFFEKL
jgi:hypothetical protein